VYLASIILHIALLTFAVIYYLYLWTHTCYIETNHFRIVLL